MLNRSTPRRLRGSCSQSCSQLRDRSVVYSRKIRASAVHISGDRLIPGAIGAASPPRCAIAMLAFTVLEFGGICTDRHPDCSNWGDAGECSSNAEFMAIHCPLTCRVCEFECTETNEHCAGWARQNECEKNVLSMMRECPIHCGICTPECRDTKYQCAGWADAGKCRENPVFMTLYCPRSCGTCMHACRDKDWQCGHWVRTGECGRNSQFMFEVPLLATHSSAACACLTSSSFISRRLLHPPTTSRLTPAALSCVLWRLWRRAQS